MHLLPSRSLHFAYCQSEEVLSLDKMNLHLPSSYPTAVPISVHRSYVDVVGFHLVLGMTSLGIAEPLLTVSMSIVKYHFDMA
jgi:hypothetical protein